jgi:phosphoglycolate phosphatase-like HAD superfamily hydrolase
MIKSIILDYDGVIAESNAIKTQAMSLLFEGNQKDIQDRMVEYHLNNEGVSRKEKFRYYYKELLRKNFSEQEINELSDKFSTLVVSKVIKSKKVAGVYDFLEKYYKKLNLFISTGTPSEEIVEILEATNMRMFFKDCFGSPEKKGEHITTILERLDCKRDEIIFVGDSRTDLEAANSNDLSFILRTHPGNTDLAKIKNMITINDFYDLTALLKKHYCL